MEEYKVPTPPTEHEPTLNQLVKFVYQHQITEKELLSGVNTYKLDLEKFDGYFYLYGKLKVNPTEPITTELIFDAIKKHNEKMSKFPPENGQGHLTMYSSIYNFKSFLKLLTKYYSFIDGLSDREYFLFELLQRCELN